MDVGARACLPQSGSWGSGEMAVDITDTRVFKELAKSKSKSVDNLCCNSYTCAAGRCELELSGS